MAVTTLPGLVAPPRPGLPPVLPYAPGPTPTHARARAKLWELNETVHCSVIGTCLTAGELRRVMAKVAQADLAGFTDHDLHAEAVGLCRRQSVAARLLHKALDARHHTAIRRFARLTGEAAVLQGWDESRDAGDIPGAYWAVLTHPDLGLAGLRRAFGDVHMLSHLIGSANRADIHRLARLSEENVELRAKVERQQTRLQDAIISRDATIQRLRKLVASREPTASRSDDDALTELHALVVDLQGRLTAEARRRDRLQQRLAESLEASRAAALRTAAAEARGHALQHELAALERHRDATAPAALPAERILYVGGRPGCIDQMRSLLDAAGGALLRHDGGRDDHPSLLPGLIGQADRVVFPVDCVSHDAALTVKRLCRQLGKRWLPLRSAGLGSFLGALAAPHLAADQRGQAASP